MEDPSQLGEDLDRTSMKLLLQDADLALTFLDLAETAQDGSRRKKAAGDARRAYQVILQKRPRFSFSDVEARVLDIKLARIKAHLKRLGQRFDSAD
ncbi:MAG TPA: hypothetical protein VMB49_16165 [Acidobacteriaceae bacterium]|nr:hypothetical protein [Acidobacteriaceae bacterium]